MITNCEITEIFYLCDEFSKEFEKNVENYRLKPNDGKKHRNKPNRLSDSEVMTILIAFHLSGTRNLKHFYLFYVCKHLQTDFPKCVSYNRFVELQQRVAMPLVLFLKLCRMGGCYRHQFHWFNGFKSLPYQKRIVRLRSLTEIVFLKVWQSKAKVVWDGFLVSNYTW